MLLNHVQHAPKQWDFLHVQAPGNTISARARQLGWHQFEGRVWAHDRKGAFDGGNDGSIPVRSERPTSVPGHQQDMHRVPRSGWPDKSRPRCCPSSAGRHRPHMCCPSSAGRGIDRTCAARHSCSPDRARHCACSVA